MRRLDTLLGTAVIEPLRSFVPGVSGSPAAGLNCVSFAGARRRPRLSAGPWLPA